MSRLTIIIVSTFLIILPATIAAPSDSEATTEKKIAVRDEWWKYKDLYTDAPRIFNVGDDNKCPITDGRRFYLDCNRCSCYQGRAAGCTRMLCGDTPQIVNWEDGKQCPAERKFYFKCNDCTCNKDGKSATCTDKPCPQPSEA